MIIWLIGMSGAGKTTTGIALQNIIRASNRNCVLLDGDVIREVFQNDLGHSIIDRKRNADRICRLGKFLDDQGVNVVCPILSIFHESQEWNRQNVNKYFEVFIDCPIELLKQRDVKGIYGKAERGEIDSVVGIDIEFPRPESPNLVFRNSFTKSAVEFATQIYEKISSDLH